MNLRSALFLSLLLLLPSPAALANKKNDEEAVLLFAHARQLSDIRADGAPAFKLKLTLKITSETGVAREGTYTEIWVSNAKWRRETSIGDFHRTEVALGRKQWLVDGAGPIPEQIEQIAGLTSLHGLRAGPVKSSKLEARTINGISVRCVTTQFGGAKSGECFISSSGTLAARMTPSNVDGRIVDSTCLFDKYQAFGERLMPTSYQCLEDKKVRLEANLVELTFGPELDQALFEPVQGGKESAHCPGSVVPPKVVDQVTPEFTSSDRGSGSVSVTTLIGVDGKPRDFNVVSSTDKGFAQEAIGGIRQWRFAPGTCDGQPMEIRIAVEVDFHGP